LRGGAGWRTSAEAARSDGLQRFGFGHDPAQGADLVQVAEHLDADGLVQAAYPDRVEADSVPNALTSRAPAGSRPARIWPEDSCSPMTLRMPP
jgi:hypothetical protein